MQIKFGLKFSAWDAKTYSHAVRCLGITQQKLLLENGVLPEHCGVCKRKFNAHKHFRINTFKSILFICKNCGSSDGVNKLPYQICLLSVRRHLIPQAYLHHDTFNMTANGNQKVNDKFLNQILKKQWTFLHLLLLSSLKLSSMASVTKPVSAGSESSTLHKLKYYIN